MTDVTQTASPVAARTTLLTVTGLHKSYLRGPEEVHALRGASFELSRGQVVALVGPSGSGKTTLLNVLAGWEHPDAGELRWFDGRPPLEERPWSELAILPQDLGLIEELSVRENIELPLRLGKRLPRDRPAADALIESLGLDRLADRSPSEASLGEQQRAALARALVVAPELLLADEPTGHQDEAWAHGVFRALRTAAANGTTCLVATHNQEASKYVDAILTIHDGLVHTSDPAPTG
jgi:ABC-type lipoprotein export system ATPase subunit